MQSLLQEQVADGAPEIRGQRENSQPGEVRGLSDREAGQRGPGAGDGGFGGAGGGFGGTRGGFGGGLMAHDRLSLYIVSNHQLSSVYRLGWPMSTVVVSLYQ
ncbi:MAG: hypothetical protein F4179_01020 [Gammaproteobacteria bacterium]|nr:hypothetical protein [Gammaproteobacteria bacterium]MYF60251.1 hypothetical protein [Gammaproteobacteria bacterium]